MIGKADEIIKWLLNQDREKLFEVKQHRQKRSLNANAYAWLLMGKIADVVRASKDEIYLEMLRKYGQRTVVSVRSDIDVKGYFKYYESFAVGYVGDTEFTHYHVFKGSSEYDTREMSVLIDGIVSEAEELEIETLPPQEIQRMKEMWRNENRTD